MPKLGPFPSTDGEFNMYVTVAVPYIILNRARLLVSEFNQTLLGATLRDWNDTYPLSQDINTRTKTATDNKDAARVAITEALRSTYGDIPQSALTNEDRNTLRLEARNTARTPSPVPNTRPVGQVNTSNRLEHVISFTDDGGAHARPKGVRGCQIWCKVGEPVVNLDELSYLGTDTSSPFIQRYGVDKAGKTIHYWLRWENTRGEVGPWSNVVTATVTG